MVISKSGVVASAIAVYCQRDARVIVPLFTNPLAASARMVAESSVGKALQCPASMVAPSAPVSERSSPPGPIAE